MAALIIHSFEGGPCQAPAAALKARSRSIPRWGDFSFEELTNPSRLTNHPDAASATFGGLTYSRRRSLAERMASQTPGSVWRAMV